MHMVQDDSWSNSSLTVVKFNDLSREVELRFPAGCTGIGCPNHSGLNFTEDKQSIKCAGHLSTFCRTVNKFKRTVNLKGLIPDRKQ